MEQHPWLASQDSGVGFARFGWTKDRVAFAATWAAIVLVMAFPPLANADGFRFGSMTLLFWLVVAAAGMCVLSSLALAFVAFQQNVAELVFVSLWFLVLSALPLVHGISAPGVLYDETATFNSAVFLAGPIGMLAGAPLLIRRGRFDWAARHWKAWFYAGTALLAVLSVGMLVFPNAVSTPATTSKWAILTAVPSVVIAATYSWRHLQFTRISGQSRYLVVFFGFAFTGAANLAWLSPSPFGPTFWFAHIFEVVGVLFGTVGAVVVFRGHEEPSDLFVPVLTADPLVALDLGLDPDVGGYIRLLDEKDAVTRTHSLRTAEAVIVVATTLGLDGRLVRDAGIAAVLHDIGKLGIPDTILMKPGQLTNEEFEVMKSHTVLGFQLLMKNPGLRDVAPIVLAHHERMDGRGYPLGLKGAEIPVAARIVAVCDAYDAMAHDRPYREGMGSEKAIAILQEHAGSQWDPTVVEKLVNAVRQEKVATSPTVLDHLGRSQREQPTYRDLLCDCVSLPPADATAGQ